LLPGSIRNLGEQKLDPRVAGIVTRYQVNRAEIIAERPKLCRDPNRAVGSLAGSFLNEISDALVEWFRGVRKVIRAQKACHRELTIVHEALSDE
jgi:hypothetical protein